MWKLEKGDIVKCIIEANDNGEKVRYLWVRFDKEA